MPNLQQSPAAKAAMSALTRKQQQSKVGALGQYGLSPFKAPAQTPLTMSAGLPFDAQTSAQRDDIVNKLNQENLGYQQGVNSTNINAANQSRDIQQSEPAAFRKLLSNFAGRGMAFSSGYGTAYGDTQKGFSDQLSAIAQKRAQQLGDLTTNRQSAQLNAQYLLDQLMGNQARNLSDRSLKNALAAAASRSLM